MKSVFPKPRPEFSQTSDGKQIYLTWRYCGKSVQSNWYGLNKIQDEEFTSDMFDIRDVMGIEHSNLISFEEAAKFLSRIDSNEIKRLVSHEW